MIKMYFKKDGNYCYYTKNIENLEKAGISTENLNLKELHSSFYIYKVLKKFVTSCINDLFVLTGYCLSPFLIIWILYFYYPDRMNSVDMNHLLTVLCKTMIAIFNFFIITIAMLRINVFNSNTHDILTRVFHLVKDTIYYTIYFEIGSYVILHYAQEGLLAISFALLSAVLLIQTLMSFYMIAKAYYKYHHSYFMSNNPSIN